MPRKQDVSFSISMFADSVEDSGDLSISLNKSSGEIVVCGEDIPSAEQLACSTCTLCYCVGII